MRRLADNAAQLHHPGQGRVKGVGNIILPQFPGTPAGYIQEPVIQGQIQIGNQRRHLAQGFQGRRQQFRIGRFRRHLDDFGDGPLAILLIPGPNRGRQVGGIDHYADEPVGLGRVMGRAQFQHHLILLAQIHLLQVAAAAQVPEVYLMAVVAVDDMLQGGAVLEHIRRTPFAGNGHIQPHVPPEIVGHSLRPPIQFPAAQRLKGVVVNPQNAAGQAPVGGADAVQIDGVRAAVDGVQAAVAGARRNHIGLNSLDQLRAVGIRLGVQDIQAGSPQGRHDQKAPFQMGMGGVGAEGGAARVPTEVMQLVPHIGHRQAVDDAAVLRRGRIQIHDGHGIRLAVGVQHGHIAQPFRRRFLGQAGRRVKGRVGSKQGHQATPLFRYKFRLSGR